MAGSGSESAVGSGIKSVAGMSEACLGSGSGGGLALSSSVRMTVNDDPHCTNTLSTFTKIPIRTLHG